MTRVSDRLKSSDRVTVRTGRYRGQSGVIAYRTGSVWVVVFADGASAQLPSTSLRRVQG